MSVNGISNAIEINAGELHTWARLSTGEIKCWGGNTNGQLGGGTTATQSSTPVSVNGISNPSKVTAGQLSHIHVLV